MPPVDPRSPSFRFSGPLDWVSRHENIVQPLQRLYEVENMVNPSNDLVADIRPTITMLQAILNQAVTDGARVRALGGGWSLSRAAATEGYMIDTKQLNWYFRLGQSSIHPTYNGDRSGLVFLQCGMSVYEVNKYLDQTYGRALKTTGASNGQTIVGAISTGTHGSAFNVGAMPDYVVGIHLVGPDRNIWLERASQPAVSDDFVARLGAELVRDDMYFDSALVSFGSFGIVHAVLVETVPLYLLETHQRRLPLDAGLRSAMTTLDFSGIPMPHPGEIPHHFEIDVNPHDVPNGVWASVMYRRPFGPYTPPDKTPGAFGPGDDLLSVVGLITPLISGAVAPIINAFGAQYLKEYSGIVGKQGEIFSNTIVHGKAMSMELGVPIEMIPDALPIVLDEARNGSFPGFIGIRYIRRSRALLAFTKFDMTCTIELQGAFSSLSQNVYNRIFDGLEHAQIPYTLHWGQMNNFTPQRVRAMYGPAVNRWIQSRHALLSPQARALFSSEFLEQCGLDG